MREFVVAVKEGFAMKYTEKHMDISLRNRDK